MKLLSNLPIEKLTRDNDYLGVIEKGDMIVSLLKSGNIEFEQMKMFALYGNWGSGKSTLMKYIESKLQDDFQTFYFDAWQYENGKDLSFSLLEFMTDEGVSKGEKIATDILKTAERVLIGSAKSLNFSIPGISFRSKELLEELEKQPKISFHKEIENFKTEFKELEKTILAESNGKKKTNIVFIDDLDRCEPEKVLDLLSEIKLFFTYGERTIFFFGVDQKAIQAAIKNKYNDNVKSNEYLEKVFDLTFHLRGDNDISKFIYRYLPDRTIKNIGSGVSFRKYMSNFFKLLKLSNPRKLKKLLNAYTIYSNYIVNRDLNGKHQLIIDEENDGSFLITIITFYLIACRLFYPEAFEKFGNKQFFIDLYERAYVSNIKNKGNSNHNNILSHTIITSKYEQSIYSSLNESVKINVNGKQTFANRVHTDEFGSFVVMFSSLQLESIESNSLQRGITFQRSFVTKNKDVGYYMMEYLFFNIHKSYDISIDIETEITPMQIRNYVKMVI